MTTKNYTTMLQLPDYESRFKYLKLTGSVGASTFGRDRYLNQILYHTSEWRRIRDYVIARDLGCDLADPDHEIFGLIIVHHMNPISKEDIELRRETVYNPEFMVCVSLDTHNAIHYANEEILNKFKMVERFQNDTRLW